MRLLKSCFRIRPCVVLRCLIVVLALCGLSGCSDATLEHAQRAANTMGPLEPSDFELIALDGQRGSLADYRGRVVILNAWATWCAPCRRELPSLQTLNDVLDAQRFVVLGVAIDEDQLLVREYLTDKGVTYNNYIDPRGERLSSALNITAYPSTFVIDREGRVVDSVAGERVWHTTEVAASLERIYVGETVRLFE